MIARLAAKPKIARIAALPPRCSPSTMEELRRDTNARPDRVVIKADAWYDLCRCQRLHGGPLLDASIASAGGFPCKFLTADREELAAALIEHRKVCK